MRYFNVRNYGRKRLIFIMVLDEMQIRSAAEQNTQKSRLLISKITHINTPRNANVKYTSSGYEGERLLSSDMLDLEKFAIAE